MLLVRRPGDDFIRATIQAHRDASLTYSAVGWTRRSAVPDGFAVNQWKAVIGNGEATFQRAKLAVQNYQMLKLGWLEQVGQPEALIENAIVCTLARWLGVYSLNVARIVYVDDETPMRFGFGYGTLPPYPLIGEERFTVELDADSNDVTFEIFSFSRPKSAIMRLARPMLLRAQRQFCVDSSLAMRAYSASDGGELTKH